MADANWEQLIDRHLAGESTPVEVAALDAWLADDPERRALLERLRAERDRLRARPASVDVDTAAGQLAAWLRARRPASARPPLAVARSDDRRPLFVRAARAARAARFRSISYLARVAAVVVVGVGVLVVWQRARPFGGALHPDWHLREFTTMPGQRAAIELPDGTRVTLAPASMLRVAADYGDRARDLVLDGAAVFDVHHDGGRPFRVRTATAVTEDLGTRFSVRAYTDDSLTEVAVAAGSVTLLSTQDTARPYVPILVRGQIARLTGAGALTVTNGADIDRALAWTHGELAFHDETLASVARSLSRWYAVDVQVLDSALAATHFTGSFATESAGTAVALVARLTGAHADWQGRLVVIAPGPSSSHPTR